MANEKSISRGAVLYRRVSTDEQVNNGTSLEAQRDACRVKAGLLNLPIVEEFADEGLSGAFLLSRQGLMSALATISAGKASHLIVANLSRLSRDVSHQQEIKKTVAEHGASIIFVEQSFDDTPEGDLAYDISGAFSAYERKLFRARSMRGRMRRVEEGIQVARSRSPYGLHVVIKDDVAAGRYPQARLGRYEVVSNEAEVVRWLFESYGNGLYSMPTMMKDLNHRSVPTPKGGLHWRASTLHDILKNPAYKGTPVYGRTKSHTDEKRLQETHALTGQPLQSARYNKLVNPEEWNYLPACEAIVTPELWESVQVKLGENKKKRGGSPLKARMLSGRIVCPECGAGMQVGAQTRKEGKCTYTYYVCGKRRNARADTGVMECSPAGYNIEHTEQATVTAILDACRRPEAIQAALFAYQKRSMKPTGVDDLRAERNAIDAALTNLAAQEQAAVQAQIAGIRQGASPDAYAAVFADLAAHRKDLENQRGEVARGIQNYSEPSLRTGDNGRARTFTTAINDVEAALASETLSGALKRDLIAPIVDSVTPHRGGATVRFSVGITGAQSLQNTCVSTQSAGFSKA